ncbi:30S ribosomal protein S16 [Capnocytophaga catalasegens]|uniref:Small ribosomal subunit protein bS16 n=1 Tax=Capnocytophaga catalasegens TaxID=1004260 RepID=A0AAV5ATL0_9FLAO|nr:30S ribosomal protein S16 [Capnocytophaga catalasegens]GIZ14482.1 30S ribosomal protein S16 [Capnocytophaga catalasegens]GJM50684.1 30S ribosomal protein S16 [Capnocytophaga catalasegens]GJM51837.1 30S ribosomal protein S16 [Capnocytophaga catalasegens]
MPVKIRLQRHGKKGKPFYWVVAADARAKRDGKFLEKLGTYNPITNPAQIELNVDAAVKWLHNGAQPTETARRILSYKGVLLKHHLEGGVKKGALTQEQADAKFQAWLQEKENKIVAKKDSLAKGKHEAKTKALEAEKAYNEKRKADAIAKASTSAEDAETQTGEETNQVEA